MRMYKKVVFLCCAGLFLTGCTLMQKELKTEEKKRTEKEIQEKKIAAKKSLEEESRSELTLPIQVKLNNQAPKYNESGELYFPRPVPSDSIIWVATPRGVTLIQCFALNQSGKPVGKEILIIMNNQTISSLKRAMGNKRFVKGHYIMTVKHNSQKVTFKFTVR